MPEAPDTTPRRPGSPLTPHERALIARLCDGGWRGAEEARAQLRHATWGGTDHDDACFLIALPADVPLPVIPPHDGGPITEVEVVDDDGLVAMLELWVEDGLLHSLDYTSYSDRAADELPHLDPLVHDDAVG